MAISADYQFEFNGLLTGPGTAYEFVSVDGLDMPPVRVQSADRHGHGLVAVGSDWLSLRVVELHLEVWGTPGSDLAGKMAALAAALIPSSSDITVAYRLEGESTRRFYARPRGRRFAVTYSATRGLYDKVTLRFEAHDPRLYADTATASTITVAAAGTQATSTLTNGGIFETLPTATLTGGIPTGWVRFTHNGLAQAVKVLTTGLATADVMVVDFATKSVAVNGAARDDLVDSTSRWFGLAAGGNSVKVDRQSTDAYATAAAFSFRDAWI